MGLEPLEPEWKVCDNKNIKELKYINIIKT